LAENTHKNLSAVLFLHSLFGPAGIALMEFVWLYFSLKATLKVRIAKDYCTDFYACVNGTSKIYAKQTGACT